MQVPQTKRGMRIFRIQSGQHDFWHVHRICRLREGQQPATPRHASVPALSSPALLTYNFILAGNS
jgi:hypothetical protein